LTELRQDGTLNEVQHTERATSPNRGYFNPSNSNEYIFEWSLQNAYTNTNAQAGFAGTLPSFASLDQGSHTITVTAYDTGGKTTVRTFTFIKDTLPPEIALGNVTQKRSVTTTVPNGITLIEDSGTTLRGTFYDAYSNLGSLLSGSNYVFEYRIYVAGDLANWATGDVGTGNLVWKTIPIGNNATKNASWNIPLPTNDGTYWLDIRVGDRIGNTTRVSKDAGDETTVKDIDHIVFAVDTRYPGITIDTRSQPENYVFGVKSSGTVLTLGGSASDVNLPNASTVTPNLSGGNTLRGVTVKINDNPSVIASTYNAGDPDANQLVTASWTKVFNRSDLANFNEGTPTRITVTATDNVNKATSVETTYIKDTTRPNVTFLNLKTDASSGFATQSLSIQGVASDTVGVYSI